MISYEGWILITGALVGMTCGIIGAYLILRRMAMMADAISHTVLLGIVVAYLVTQSLEGLPMLIGATLAGLLTTFLVQWFHSRGVQHDASIGVVFTSLFAIGVILISTQVGNVHLDVQHALMGEIAFIPWNTTTVFGFDIPVATLMLLIVFIIVLAAILFLYKEWKILAFDPALALSLGLPVIFLHYVFMGLVSITTVASFDAVGAIMVVAMLITPAAAAYLWTERLSLMIVLSALFGIASAISGYYVAYWIDSSISGSMAMMTGVVFLLSFLLSPSHGLLAKWILPKEKEQASLK